MTQQTEKLRVPARYLIKGDRVGTDETVQWVGAGVRTPRGKVEVHLEKDDYARRAVWGASTVINVRRAPAAPAAPAAAEVGPHDMIRADGSYNWEVLKLLARRRAENEVAKVEAHISAGRLTPDHRTTVKEQIRPALRHCRELAMNRWSGHEANRASIEMVTVTSFARPQDGVRRSAF